MNTIKKILIGFFILFVFSAFPFKLKAQGVTPTPQPPTFCFISTRCRDVKDVPCKTQYPGHSARLKISPGKGPLPNSKVYVIESITSSLGTFYSSGYSQVDMALGYAPKPKGFKWGFKGMREEDTMTLINQHTHPLKTNALGELTTDEGAPVSALEWTDVTDKKNKGKRRFFGISISENNQPLPTVLPQSTINPTMPNSGGQQLGLVPGNSNVTTFPISAGDNPQDCVSIVWDPDGRVFDSQSLEPIPNALVNLLKKRENNLFSSVNVYNPEDVPNGLLINPYPTEEDGYFSFFVPDGTYKIIPQISGYNFPGSLSLNKNYVKIYSDIYPLLTGIEIVEKGGPQHRDIPVDPVDGKPGHYPIKIMDYGYQSDRISSLFIDGRVSHPLATIKAYSIIPDSANPTVKNRYKLLKTIQADKLGRFSLIINQSSFDVSKNELFGEIEATKTNSDNTLSDINSLPAILKLEPIPTYIEGYAINNEQILSGAKVEIVNDYATNSYYQTTSDINGYFKIPSEYISFIPYKLRYSLDNLVINIPTSKFIIENSDYIKANKTRLFYPQYNNPQLNINIKNSLPVNDNKLTNNSGVKKVFKNSTLIMILLSVILLMAVGAIGVYLIKNNRNTTGK